nr:uncharacterized protein LOC123745327 isoform X2 [Procambarus clarkii]
MSEGSSPQQVTVAAVVTARVHLQDTLRQARLRAQELGSHFIDQGIGVLCQGIGIYSELFKRSGLQDRKALELAISKSPNDVKAAALELLEVEDDWNEFLSVVEASDVSRKESSIPEIGDKIPSTVSLYRVCDGVSAQDTSVGTPAAITLAELLESSTQSATLLVLNRHFA